MYALEQQGTPATTLRYRPI